MKCPNCGTDNPAGKIVCRSCGRRLRPGSQATGAVWQTEEDLMARVRSDMLRIVVVTAIVVATGIALGFAIR